MINETKLYIAFDFGCPLYKSLGFQCTDECVQIPESGSYDDDVFYYEPGSYRCHHEPNYFMGMIATDSDHCSPARLKLLINNAK